MAKSLVCGHEYEHDGWPTNELCPDCWTADAEASLDEVHGYGEAEWNAFYARKQKAADALAVALIELLEWAEDAELIPETRLRPVRIALHDWQKVNIPGVPPPDTWSQDKQLAYCPRCGFLKRAHADDKCPTSEMDAAHKLGMHALLATRRPAAPRRRGGGERKRQKPMSEFENIKPEKHYKRISNGDVFTGQQLLNLLDIATPMVQAILLLDIWETDEPVSKPRTKYGV